MKDHDSIAKGIAKEHKNINTHVTQYLSEPRHQQRQTRHIILHQVTFVSQKSFMITVEHRSRDLIQNRSFVKVYDATLMMQRARASSLACSGVSGLIETSLICYIKQDSCIGVVRSVTSNYKNLL